MSKLVPELLLHIFRFLRPVDLAAASRVCLLWKDLAFHNTIWKELCWLDWRIDDASLRSSWRKIYIERHILYNKYKKSIQSSLEDFFQAIIGDGEQNALPWENLTAQIYIDNQMKVSSVHYKCKRTKKLLYALKVIGVISVPMLDAEAIIIDLNMNKKWDSTLLLARVQQKLSAQTDIILVKYKNLKMLCARTVVDVPDTDTKYIITTSIEKMIDSSDIMQHDDAEEFSENDHDHENSHHSSNNNNNHNEEIQDSDSQNSENGNEMDDYLSGLTKRGSGFAIKAVDADHSEITYLLQLEEGEWVDKASLQWMIEARWDTVLQINRVYRMLNEEENSVKKRKLNNNEQQPQF